jgi:hypothetical protein
MVLDVFPTATVLKQVIVICTPGVDDNPGLVEWPLPLTAKGVSASPSMRNYDHRVDKEIIRIVFFAMGRRV